MARVDLSIRIADVEEFRLFIWELRQLIEDMRVAADPFSERLEHAIDRFTDEPDEKPEKEN